MKSLKILLIDDNKAVGESLGLWLELAGHQIKVALSGSEGVKLFSDFCPDIVITDIHMPDIDGYQVARTIRAMNRGETWIIAISGYPPASKNLNDEAIFDHYLVKPPNMKKLKKIISDYMGRNED